VHSIVCAKNGLSKRMVDRAGFEPAYGNPGRFTVCCL
jgi:hypothetical protein